MRLGPATVVWTSAADGDLGLNSSPVQRAEAHQRPWLQLKQVHGDRVVVANDLSLTGTEADAAVTARPNLTLGVATADCAPIALSSEEGVIGAVHAGWKGLRAGVIERAVEAMGGLGATYVTAALGPCIHAECYEFDAAALEGLASEWGSDVAAKTSAETPALDMVAAVGAVCRKVGVEVAHVSPVCTGCDVGHFSHRVRQDRGRQVMLVWRDGD